jgi:hypothetical protein
MRLMIGSSYLPGGRTLGLGAVIEALVVAMVLRIIIYGNPEASRPQFSGFLQPNLD